MGLAASQSRLLMLTTRQSNIESSLMNIANEKMALSRQSSLVSAKYSDALNQTKLVMNNTDGNTTNLSYDALMGQNTMLSGAGQYLLTDSKGAVILDKNYASALKLSTTSGTASDLGTRYEFAAKMLNAAGYTSLTPAACDSIVNGTTAPTVNTANYFTTSYKDTDVYQQLNNMNPNAFTASPATPNVIPYYTNAGDNNHTTSIDPGTAASQLLDEVSSVTNATASAVVAVLQNSFGSNWSSVSKAINAAADRAELDTKAFYSSKSPQAANNSANDIIAISETANTTGLFYDPSIKGCHSNGVDNNDGVKGNEIYVDRNQEIKTFLAFFDQECYNIALPNSNYNPANSSSYDTAGQAGIYSNQTTGSTTQGATAEFHEHGVAYSGGMFGSWGKDDNWWGASGYATSSCTNRAQVNGVELGGTGSVNMSSAATPDTPGGTVAKGTVEKYLKVYDAIAASGAWTTIDSVDNSDSLQKDIQYGNVNILQLQDDGSWGECTTSSSGSPLASVSDTSAASAAEADYNSEKDKISYNESMLDIQSSNLDTERSSITTEITSVQSLLKRNFDSFKVFDSNG